MWPLAAAYVYTMGSPCCIKSASQKNNWPSCSHWQLHMYMQWAYSVALGALPKKIVSPDIAVSSHIFMSDGSALLYWWRFLKKIISPDVAIWSCSYAFSMGWPYCIGNDSENIYGPRCNEWPPHTHMPWAHPVASGTLPKQIIGLNVAIRTCS